MTEIQRINSDIATIDRRQIADKATNDNRDRNDRLTANRRLSADNAMQKSRVRNDEETLNRREMKDGSPNIALAVSLLALTALAVVILFVVI